MINEKIQMMLKELHQECEKEGVSALCTLNKEGTTSFMSVGTLPEIGFCLAVQEKRLDEYLPLPTKIIRNVGLDALGEQTEKIKPDHTFVVNSAEDIPDILNRIIKGDFQ
ncbi:hypothetical protein [Enterococcus raffinosus]|uniref:Uncharacterized protein n=1 Tax=Enterococcus raffinosus ATCC 49464 TaxID=1158602 RepID=R2NQ06_9ENTE|nr:hypothetical protein [Enterococcus raffinosus]EOH74112.1 hypothetical protein UAK_03932 [Enterococcus raffinosus ATCC 49464]EOT82248.1 hypothetical protein I590_00673 [Enterococcus raffinosus ATCC 49464]UXK04503.1 hypothetical protein N7K38_01680 [Enterococcus raffinosus]HDU2614970.1 hypothetical protein [Enterococcus faecalis]